MATINPPIFSDLNIFPEVQTIFIINISSQNESRGIRRSFQIP